MKFNQNLFQVCLPVQCNRTSIFLRFLSYDLKNIYLPILTDTVCFRPLGSDKSDQYCNQEWKRATVKLLFAFKFNLSSIDISVRLIIGHLCLS